MNRLECTFINKPKVLLFAASLFLFYAVRVHGQAPASAASDSRLAVTLPAEGKLVHDKPVGKNWVNMLTSLDGWTADPRYWSLKDGGLHGDYDGGKLHNFSWTKKTYQDFELNVLIKMTGTKPNSGVCIRIHPTDPDNAPATKLIWEKVIGAVCGRNGGSAWCSYFLKTWFPSWSMRTTGTIITSSPKVITFKPGSME
jgi:3-keto-disaccharide hydrolase